ncbi:hypothetical protein [Celeribacter sp.]|uniref:hypothetical protein n=1 Tax=Celeribacter sp. TaxID=1890673 RepID=UPI003A8CA5A6
MKKTLLGAAGFLVVAVQPLLAGERIMIEPSTSSGDKVGAVILGLFVAYVIGSTIGKGGTTMSTKDTDAAFEKPKGKLLKKF